jgi:hypothetical protein
VLRGLGDVRLGDVLIVALGLVLVVALATSARADDARGSAVSLIQLIADPASFDGKRVTVTGYVVLEAENTAVYLQESDARYGITRNAVWLQTPVPDELGRARFHGRYVRIDGTFNARRRGHFEMFGGSIERIGLFDVVEPRPGPLPPPQH